LTLVGGIGGFVTATLMPDVYVAETAVIATQSTVTADQIGPIAQTAFATDPVLQQVVDRLNLQGSPASLISTGALEARSLSDGPALQITGRASDPNLAADLANAATEAFVTVAQEKGLGTFAAFESVGPGILQPHHTGLLILLGILAGAGLGILVLVIVFFLRDPIVSEDDARRIFSPDAAFRLRVGARRALAVGEDGRPQADAEFHESSTAVFSLLSETVRDRVEHDGRGASAVIVDGGDSVWAAAAVARELEARVGDDASRRERPGSFSISSSDPRLPEILGARDAIVAIVPSGAPRRSLQRLDEEIHTLGGRFRILVLVDPRR
jgi:capsular polysaccharide biosynthesis protein